MKLSAARIFVRDIVEARKFYVDRLGLAIEAHDDQIGFCVFDTGSTKLIVEALAADDLEGDDLVGRFTGLSFPVDDIASEYGRLTASGVEFNDAPEQQPWGGWLATFLDPAGNRLQLVQEPTRTP